MFTSAGFMRPFLLSICVAVALAGSLQASNEPRPQVIPAPSRPEGTVYLTKWGKKYHKDNCRHLKNGSTAMKLEEARKRFAPCALCKPPS
jgi:hypothetical protein